MLFQEVLSQNVPQVDAVSLQQSKHGVLLLIRVRPKSKVNKIEGMRDGVLLVSVTAAPTDGQANAAVIATVAKALGCGRSTLSVARGAKSREKAICISQLSIEEIELRLTLILSSD